jgi:ribose-phosphate pyrophosphokinase
VTDLAPRLPDDPESRADSLMTTSLPIEYDKRLMLVSGRANPELAVRIGDRLGVDLGPVTLKTFANGEVYCRFEESIRGADVFIVQPTCGNEATGVTANDALMELMVMIDAAVGASAHRVIAVTPWYGYSRQDKKSSPREPISARLVARMLESAGADRVLTMDLHAGQVQGFFQIPVDHMTALPMFARHFRDMGFSGEGTVVVSGDAGSVLAGDASVMLSDGFHGNGGGRAGRGDDGSGSRGSAVNWVASVVYLATCA